MPIPCTVCHHPKRSELEREVYKTGNMSAVARQFGLNKHAVRGHMKNHVAKEIQRRQAKREKSYASKFEQLLDRAAKEALEGIDACKKAMVPLFDRSGKPVMRPKVDKDGKPVWSPIDGQPVLEQVMIAKPMLRTVPSYLNQLHRNILIRGHVEGKLGARRGDAAANVSISVVFPEVTRSPGQVVDVTGQPVVEADGKPKVLMLDMPKRGPTHRP